jgi:hypothetical protein
MNQDEMEAYVAQVASDAERAFGAHLDRPLLEAYAREAVLDMWLNGAKVTNFTAELALNQIHAAIARRAQTFAAQTHHAA